MKKYLSSVCSLFLVLTFFVGSLLNVNAYNIDTIELSGLIGVFNFTSTSSDSRSFRFRFNTSSSTVFDAYIPFSDIDATYELLNPSFSGVTRFRVGTASVPIDFVYAPDMYDYYILVSVHTNDLTHTFIPNRAQVYTYYEDAEEYKSYSLEDVSVLHKSDSNTTGFTLIGKLPDDIDNSSICNLYLDGNSGNVGANCVFEGLIFMFDKASQNASSSIISAINNSATKISNSVTSSGNKISNSVIESGESIENKIESTFTDDNSETQNLIQGGLSDVEDSQIIQDVNGVENSLSNMFKGSVSPGGSIVFPSFTIDIDGQSYQLWQAETFDLSFLDENFPFLMTTIRSVLSILVCVATFNGVKKQVRDIFHVS